MLDAGLSGRVTHAFSICKSVGQRLFAKNVLAVPNSLQRNVTMQFAWNGDANQIHILACHHLPPVGLSFLSAELAGEGSMVFPFRAADDLHGDTHGQVKPDPRVAEGVGMRHAHEAAANQADTNSLLLPAPLCSREHWFVLGYRRSEVWQPGK